VISPGWPVFISGNSSGKEDIAAQKPQRQEKAHGT
jgi:hypothetical protein